jgi:hypothetical protein
MKWVFWECWSMTRRGGSRDEIERKLSPLTFTSFDSEEFYDFLKSRFSSLQFFFEQFRFFSRMLPKVKTAFVCRDGYESDWGWPLAVFPFLLFFLSFSITFWHSFELAAFRRNSLTCRRWMQIRSGAIHDLGLLSFLCSGLGRRYRTCRSKDSRPSRLPSMPHFLYSWHIQTTSPRYTVMIK